MELSINNQLNNEINLEEIYNEIKKLRINKNNKEAYQLYISIPKNHSLYANYYWQLEYEYSVFAYYIGIKNINNQLITIMNNCNNQSIIKNVLSNMKFYHDILKSQFIYDFTFSLKHILNNIEYNFNSSSSCIIPYNKGYLLNVRMVNYKIDSNGKYNCGSHVITINKCIELSSDFTIINEKILDVEYIDRQHIGIEDIRIFYNNIIHFIGTTHHKDNMIGIVYGVYNNTIYNNTTNIILQSNEIKPAFNMNSTCEKNWVYVEYKNKIRVIYSWNPLKICEINNELLDIIEEKPMPQIFKYVRGSSCGFSYMNEIWFAVHIVSYETPRHYYHMLVIFNNDLNLLRYSAPFKFEKECIEYCIGLIVEDERIIMTYSTWDRTTKIGIYDKKYINGLIIYK